jgi:hypothetical protein
VTVAIVWPCPSCGPIVATGTVGGGRILVALHGPGCDQPVERRQTLVHRIAGSRAA